MTNWFPIVGANKDCIRIMCIRCLPFTKHFLSYPHRDFVRMSACDREFFMQNSGDSKWHWKRKKLYCMCKKNYSFLKVSECYSNTWVPLGVRRLYMWRCICEQVQSRRSEALSFTFERSALRRWIEKQAYEVCKGQWYNEDSYEAWICSVWNSRCMRDSTSRTNHKRKQLWKFKSIFISYIVFLN